MVPTDDLTEAQKLNLLQLTTELKSLAEEIHWQELNLKEYIKNIDPSDRIALFTEAIKASKLMHAEAWQKYIAYRDIIHKQDTDS